MSNVTDEVRDHQFDGIQEYDNPLPRWWLWLFYISVAFGVAYVPLIHFTEGRTIEAEYVAEVAAAEAKYGLNKIDWNNDELTAHCGAGDGWRAGAEANFKSKCASCHREDGGGMVGPSFADDHYIHGGRLADLAAVITEGVPAKGMIPWGKQLKPDEIRDLSCYIRSMRGTEVDKPKAPQGDKVDADGVPLKS